MSESGAAYVIPVHGARYADWERTRVELTDGRGNRTGAVVDADYPGVAEFVARGGVIEPRGPQAEELAYYQRLKVAEIERCADERLKRYESDFARRARVARIVRGMALPSDVWPIRSGDQDLAVFEAATLVCAENYIHHVQGMVSIDTVREFDPAMMAWPKRP